MTDAFELCSFRSDDATKIIGWIRSPEEARVWCGHTGDDPPAATIFLEWHNDSDLVPYVLISDTGLVGYGEIWIDHDEREIELARLIVHPEYRNRGIGRRLVEELIIVASGFGFDSAYLRVFPENSVAISCYRHAGFEGVPEHVAQQFNANQPVAYYWMHRRLND